MGLNYTNCFICSKIQIYLRQIDLRHPAKIAWGTVTWKTYLVHLKYTFNWASCILCLARLLTYTRTLQNISEEMYIVSAQINLSQFHFPWPCWSPLCVRRRNTHGPVCNKPVIQRRKSPSAKVQSWSASILGFHNMPSSSLALPLLFPNKDALFQPEQSSSDPWTCALSHMV